MTFFLSIFFIIYKKMYLCSRFRMKSIGKSDAFEDVAVVIKAVCFRRM